MAWAFARLDGGDGNGSVERGRRGSVHMHQQGKVT